MLDLNAKEDDTENTNDEEKKLIFATPPNMFIKKL